MKRGGRRQTVGEYNLVRQEECEQLLGQPKDLMLKFSGGFIEIGGKHDTANSSVTNR